MKILLLLTALLSGCAGRAPRCDGALRPIDLAAAARIEMYAMPLTAGDGQTP